MYKHTADWETPDVASDYRILSLEASVQVTLHALYKIRLYTLQGMPECIKPYESGRYLDVASRYRILVTTCVSVGVL